MREILEHNQAKENHLSGVAGDGIPARAAAADAVGKGARRRRRAGPPGGPGIRR